MNNDYMIIDGFCGGGGASVGIEMALGRAVDIAVNHDPKAILMHQTNHPDSIHLTEDIFNVNLNKYVQGRHVGLMWMSPDCTSHSKAKGSQPRERGLRMLPWAVYKHTKAIKPDVVIMENVEEIQQWGPLDSEGHPIPERKGEEYKKFINAMIELGYKFESRELVGADYGAPTTRKRWYAIFRCDNKPIVWPKPTHNRYGTNGLKPWVPAYTAINYSDTGKSIFEREKPLAEKTLQRIARGCKKFVFECENPFILELKDGKSVPFIDKAYGGSYKGAGSSIAEPLHTITTVDHNRLVSPILVPINKTGFSADNLAVAAFITKFYKSGTGQSMLEPLHTITTSPGHFGQVSVFMVPKNSFSMDDETMQKCSWVSQYIMEYYGNGTGQSLNDPLHTIVTKDRFALISVLGNEYVIIDIRLRMLIPDELKIAQGFPLDYIIDRDYMWNAYPKVEQTAKIGNSVVPVMAKVLVEANCGYMAVGKRRPNMNVITRADGQLQFAI